MDEVIREETKRMRKPSLHSSLFHAQKPSSCCLTHVHFNQKHMYTCVSHCVTLRVKLQVWFQLGEDVAGQQQQAQPRGYESVAYQTLALGMNCHRRKCSNPYSHTSGKHLPSTFGHRKQCHITHKALCLFQSPLYPSDQLFWQWEEVGVCDSWHV